MSFYAYRLGMLLEREPVLLSLANNLWWGSSNKTHTSPLKIWEEFLKNYIDTNKLVCRPMFWQEIIPNINRERGLEELHSYLESHPSLKLE